MSQVGVQIEILGKPNKNSLLVNTVQLFMTVNRKKRDKSNDNIPI